MSSVEPIIYDSVQILEDTLCLCLSIGLVCLTVIGVAFTLKVTLKILYGRD